MGHIGWHQTWRKPLREAMDWLRDQLAPFYEQEAAKYLKAPWAARNRYIDVVLDRSRSNVEAFLSEQAKDKLSEVEKRRVLKLMEMQRFAMLIYASCGWFFDEISGIETVQVIMYAARAMQLAHDLFQVDLEKTYCQMLESAPSNIPEFHDGAKVYSIFVKPAIVDFPKVSAQHTIMNLFSGNGADFLPPRTPNPYFKVSTSNTERRDDGRFRILVNRSNVYSNITFDDDHFGGAALWLGDHNISCGVMPNMPNDAFLSMRQEMIDHFEKGEINEILVMLTKYFGQNIYSVKDLFKDNQRYILNQIVAGRLKAAKDFYETVYHENSAMLRFMKEIRSPPPKPLFSAAEMALNLQLAELLSSKKVDLDKLQRTVAEFKNLPIEVDSKLISFQGREKVADEFNKLLANPNDVAAIREKICLIQLLTQLPITFDLWQAQNAAYKIAQNEYQIKKTEADEASKGWVAAFTELCDLIGIKLA